MTNTTPDLTASPTPLGEDEAFLLACFRTLDGERRKQLLAWVSEAAEAQLDNDEAQAEDAAN